MVLIQRAVMAPTLGRERRIGNDTVHTMCRTVTSGLCQVSISADLAMGLYLQLGEGFVAVMAQRHRSSFLDLYAAC